ncbi:MAG: FtsW/RodA/SpoVE family cell cycle protein [Armatimonadota bacterium]
MRSIPHSRRRELLLLLFAAGIVALGGALVCVGMGQPLWRLTRGLSVVGAFIAGAMMLDLADPRRDRWLLPIIALISGMGFLLLWQLDEGSAARQVVWMLTGAGIMVAVYYLIEDVRNLSRLKYTSGAFALVLVGLTLAFGVEKGGARLWLAIPGLVSFQPTELVKVLMCIFLAGFISERGELLREDTRRVAGVSVPRARHVLPVLLMVLFALAIFVGQRDLGAAVLFFGLFVGMTYLATGRKLYALVALALFAAGGVGAYYVFPHVATRVQMWLDPWADPTGRGYQILQSLFALAEGGIVGTGFATGGGASIPAATTDLIFAVGAEQLGLVGAAAIVVLFAFASLRSFSIAWRCTDSFGALLAAGLAIVFSLQTLVIIGGVIRLIPLTGITLPFMSYGGTSVVVNFIALALLLVISRDCVPHRLADES